MIAQVFLFMNNQKKVTEFPEFSDFDILRCYQRCTSSIMALYSIMLLIVTEGEIELRLNSFPKTIQGKMTVLFF